MNKLIDINFNFYSDTPSNKDPDFYSPTLRKYHKFLWSKKLPNGNLFDLSDRKSKVYLYHDSNLGEFFLASDAITHSYKNTKRMYNIINQISSEKIDSFFSIGSTIGGYIIFPSNKINKKMTINQARGINSKIKDRFDLTLECIRLYYNNKESPLYDVLERYSKFFSLFEDFKGYVDFFLLQDLVSSNYASIKFHLKHNCFDESPLPLSVDEYLEYRQNTISFIKNRNNRILEAMKKYKNN